MLDLRAELESRLQGRVCFVGLGNAARGDDGAGMRLAEALRDRTRPGEVQGGKDGVIDAGAYSVALAGTALERWGSDLARGDFERYVFLDAVDFGGCPGSVVWLEAEEICARYPQVSTHGLSLGAWARWIEAGGVRRVGLLGIQPQSFRSGEGLSAPVAAAVLLLTRWIGEIGA